MNNLITKLYLAFILSIYAVNILGVHLTEKQTVGFGFLSYIQFAYAISDLYKVNDEMKMNQQDWQNLENAQSFLKDIIKTRLDNNNKKIRIATRISSAEGFWCKTSVIVNIQFDGQIDEKTTLTIKPDDEETEQLVCLENTYIKAHDIFSDLPQIYQLNLMNFFNSSGINFNNEALDSEFHH